MEFHRSVPALQNPALNAIHHHDARVGKTQNWPNTEFSRKILNFPQIKRNFHLELAFISDVMQHTVIYSRNFNFPIQLFKILILLFYYSVFRLLFPSFSHLFIVIGCSILRLNFRFVKCYFILPPFEVRFCLPHFLLVQECLLTVPRLYMTSLAHSSLDRWRVIALMGYPFSKELLSEFQLCPSCFGDLHMMTHRQHWSQNYYPRFTFKFCQL